MVGGQVTEEHGEHQVDWARMENETSGDEPQFQVLSPEMLARRLLWDVVPCPLAVKVGAFMGLPPASEEIEDMEHQQSHQRLQQAYPTVPFIMEFAKHATKAVVGANILGMSDDEPEVTEEEKDEITVKLYPMIYQTALAMVAELIDVGILHLPHYQFVTVEEDGEEQEETEDHG